MKFVFRVDASLSIGTGHVMRCLTLAEALRAKGGHCHFISRAHPGNLIALIQQRGFGVAELPAGLDNFQPKIKDAMPLPAHASWLGEEWLRDAEQTLDVLRAIRPDWLIVDHYAIDQRWEERLKTFYQQLMVIDDLADRDHACDLLLDQNLGRKQQDYLIHIPLHCRLLIGPRYALLRPEFAALRDYSLRRRAQPQVKHLLITMGGVDQPDATSQVLEVLREAALPKHCCITVVMGLHAPWLEQVRALAAKLPWPTEVKVNVRNMAQLMADCDLAIGAAGSTSWERCCLGLPALLIILACNQETSCKALASIGAAIVIGKPSCILGQLPKILNNFLNDPEYIKSCSKIAKVICNGSGVAQLTGILVNGQK